ncbi:MAG: hypothetical protein CML67_01930 [Rhodobacteraceae bacterium]|nr:hypothetical protein [Paracoccaceae bacterium]
MTGPKRIQLRRTKGWRKPENTVVVSRPSNFGNPFTVKGAYEAGIPNPQEAAVEAFRDWLNGDPWACPADDDFEARRRWILDHVADLRGKNLACWCRHDQPCHADVLLEMANAEDG